MHAAFWFLEETQWIVCLSLLKWYAWRLALVYMLTEELNQIHDRKGSALGQRLSALHVASRYFFKLTLACLHMRRVMIYGIWFNLYGRDRGRCNIVWKLLIVKWSHKYQYIRVNILDSCTSSRISWEHLWELSDYWEWSELTPPPLQGGCLSKFCPSLSVSIWFSCSQWWWAWV